MRMDKFADFDRFASVGLRTTNKPAQFSHPVTNVRHMQVQQGQSNRNKTGRQKAAANLFLTYALLVKRKQLPAVKES